MRTAELNLLKLLDRRRLGRTNFLSLAAGGSAEHNRKMLYELARKGHITEHGPDGGGKETRAYPKTFFRIYENNDTSDILLRQSGIEPHERGEMHEFWHQLLVDHILLSIETACNKKGLEYHDISHFTDLPCEISHTINGKHVTSKAAWRPDALFRIGNRHYALEADRGTEPIERKDLQATSYLRKLLQIRYVFQNKLYQSMWDIPGLTVVTVPIAEGRATNIMHYIQHDLKWKSSFLLFRAAPSLASTIRSPIPALDLITEPWQRVGYPPFSFLDPQ